MNLGGTEVAAMRLGSEEVTAAYLGATLVWTSGVRLAGALASSTALTGSLATSRHLLGEMAAVSAMAGGLSTQRVLAGAMASASAMSGDITVTDETLLAGVLAVQSSLAGGMAVERRLGGGVAGVSALAGGVVVERGLSGAMTAASAMSGDLDVPAPPAVVSSAPTNGPNSSSPAVVNLPASLVAGNKIVIIFGHNPTATVTTPSGWALLDTVQSTIGTNDRKLYIFEKVSDGAEGATVNITISGQTWSAVAFQVSGSASATLIAKVGASVASANPDPPNNNPGVSAETLWIAVACKRQTTALSAAPSGYANMVTAVSSGSNVSTAAAEKTSTASSEDPGTFTGTGSDNWAAMTLGFRA